MRDRHWLYSIDDGFHSLCVPLGPGISLDARRVLFPRALGPCAAPLFSSILKSVCMTLALLATPAASAWAQTPPQTQQTQTAQFRTEEIDQLVSPIALYPDQLLVQVLMASTYPFEVAQAAQFAKSNPNLKGQALVNTVNQRNWDDSVKALVETPQVLQMMSERLDWMQKLGDAFLAQQIAVMEAVQRLRKRAIDNGTLKDTEQQQVVTEGQTIVVQSADPEVIYVPSYDPGSVYGSWPYPAYPPYPYYPYPGYGLAAAGIGFLAGAAIGRYWNSPHVDWHSGNININNSLSRNNYLNRNSNITGNRNWAHDPTHRRGTNYRDSATRDRFGRGDNLANARQNFRGRDGGQLGGGRGQVGQNRPGVSNPIAGGGRGQVGQNRPGVSNPIAGGGRGTSLADRRGTGGSFSGLDRGSAARFDSARGQASRGGGFQGSNLAQNRGSRGVQGTRGGASNFRGGASSFRGGGGGGFRGGGGARGGGRR